MKKSTRIVIVLDRSGSMNQCRNSTITGFNTFLSKQKELPGEATLKLVQFDSNSDGMQYDTVFDGDIRSIENLTLETFIPRGSTPLLDAQGKTIVELGEELAAMKENDRPEKVMFVTISDGEENSSQKYDRIQIRNMITHQSTKYSWDFVYLGANQDAVSVGAQMGYSRNKSMSFNAGSVKANAATWGNLNSYAATVRSSSVADISSLAFSDEERSSSMTGDASLQSALDDLVNQKNQAKK